MSLPAKTEWMIEQMNHTPTREYSENISAIVKRFGYKNAIEIGCMWGVSTLSILLNGDGMLRSVDSSNWTHAEEEVRVNNLAARWRFTYMDSLKFWEANADKFDLVYIDGDHRYRRAKPDLDYGWKFLNKGGVLVVDDVVHKYNRDGEKQSYGVSVAAWELLKDNKVTDLGFVGDMLWLQK